MTFSRWFGPFVGALVGLITGMLEGFKNHSLGFWGPLMLGGGVGLAGGFLVMIADPAPAEKTKDVTVDPKTLPNLPGNVLCAMGLIFFFMPFFSIFLSGFALCLNWRVKGWARRLSWLGLLLGFVMTSLMVWHWTSLESGI